MLRGSSIWQPLMVLSPDNVCAIPPTVFEDDVITLSEERTLVKTALFMLEKAGTKILLKLIFYIFIYFY